MKHGGQPFLDDVPAPTRRHIAPLVITAALRRHIASVRRSFASLLFRAFAHSLLPPFLRNEKFIASNEAVD